MTIPDVTIGPFGWTCIVVGVWLILACVVVIPAGRAMRKADRQPEPEIVNWLPLLPLVPPSRREPDADWLDVWPVDGLSDDEVYVRFNRLMDAA